MDELKGVRIFLASPSEVASERTVAQRIVEEMNRFFWDRGLAIRLLKWETDTLPAFGSDPQSLVNAQIGRMEDYDLFIGILWNRFGQPTPRAESGTKEEFDRAVASFETNGKPEIWLYFGQALAPFNSEEALDQRRRVLQFKSHVQTYALTRDYQDSQQFADLLREDLLRWLSARVVTAPHAPAEDNSSELTNTPATSQDSSAEIVIESGSWILLKNGFFPADSFRDSIDGIVTVRIKSESAQSDDIIRSLRADRFGHSELVPYAYQNDAAFARVLSVEQESIQGQSVWTITLRPDRDMQSRYSSEMSYGNSNISADDIALLRAKLLLLNERSQIADHGLLLDALIAGVNTPIQVTSGLFPRLWNEFKDNQDKFLPLARLTSVFYLKASNICESIVNLALGPVIDERLHVNFRGRRHQYYSNQPATEITVSGTCTLSDTNP